MPTSNHKLPQRYALRTFLHAKHKGICRVLVAHRTDRAGYSYSHLYLVPVGYQIGDGFDDDAGVFCWAFASNGYFHQFLFGVQREEEEATTGGQNGAAFPILKKERNRRILEKGMKEAIRKE